MSKKLHIKKGDSVVVISGNSKSDKPAEVLEVLVEKNKAIVKDTNIITKHVKPSATNPEGGITKTEAPVHISNLMLVEPSTGKPTKVGRKLNDKGVLQRYSKKTGEFI